MTNSSRKIILHSTTGYRPAIEALVAEWIAEGVRYVGIVGVDASRLEDRVDEICIGDGSDPYFMLTAFHDLDETVEDAVRLAEQISTDDFSGEVHVIELR